MFENYLVFITSLVGVAHALPQASNDAVGRLIGTEDIVDHGQHGVAIDGALDRASKYYAYASTATSAPEPTPGPSMDKVAAALTIRITNAWHSPISTRHARNDNAPPAVGGDVGPGTVGVFSIGQFAVPTQWAGMVAVVEASGSNAIVGDESLIEASFVDQFGSGALVDVDVSYVDGFSLPVTCSCGGKVVTGCNRHLRDLNTCPDDNGRGSCRNPNRNGGTRPSKFFAPCRGAAYTFPSDHGANSNGECTGGVIDCCVGEMCPGNPSQPS